MKARALVLFLLGLAAAWTAASFQRAPGYMDADYYFLGALELADGHGFKEWVLWNYLDDPAGLPHPSHGYWLPGASTLAAIGLALTGSRSFEGAQLGFILLSALIPPLTAALASRLYADWQPASRRRASWIAGLLAVFSGYYTGFLTTTDSFGLMMVLGVFFYLVLAGMSDKPKASRIIALGAIVGAMHLTRTEAPVWLLAAMVLLWRFPGRGRLILALLGGYLIVTAPWFLRNLSVFGAPLAPGGTRALWMTTYDDLFIFPPDQLTPDRWLSAGPGSVLGGVLRGAWMNLQSSLAVNGLIFLALLILWGAIVRRRTPVVRAGTLTWVGIFLVMSLVFPYSGARGGYFHAAAGLQPLFWALVPEGLEQFVQWGREKRDWHKAQASRVFGSGVVLIAALVSMYLGWVRLVQPARDHPSGLSSYRMVAVKLDSLGISQDAPVMVNNPPGFRLASGRTAIVIPSGGAEAILAAAARYGAVVLVLGPEQGLDELMDPDRPPPVGLTRIGEVGELQLFAFGGMP